MNQPYVKQYAKNDKGETVLTNPIPAGGYFSEAPNRKLRRSWMRGKRKFNCRKGRNYYQPRMTPVYDHMQNEAGERVRFIAYSVPDGTTICHRKTNR